MKLSTFTTSLTVALAMVATSYAGTSAGKNPEGKNPIVEPTEEKSIYDKIWDLPVLYKNKDNPFIQEFRLVGRYHTQYSYTEADQGNFDDWETRRSRIGFRTKLFNQLELRNEWNISGLEDEDFDPDFESLDLITLEWKPSKEFGLTIGKHRPLYTLEFRTSANEVPAFERSILTSALANFERSYGVSLSGEVNSFNYYAGIFAAQPEGDKNEWFDNDGGVFSVVRVGYDFGGQDKAFSKALLTLEYTHTEKLTRFSPRMEDVVSLAFSGKTGNFGIGADLLGGFGEKGDMAGIVIVPTYDITKKLQLATRYAYATGDDDTIPLRRRYEGSVTKGAGDEAHSFYVGLNYFFYGHKLKLMTGAEYLTVNDSANNGGEYDGWTLFTGLRMHF